MSDSWIIFICTSDIYLTNARSFRHPVHMLQFPLFFFLLTAKKSIESVKLRVPQKYHIYQMLINGTNWFKLTAAQ